MQEKFLQRFQIICHTAKSLKEKRYVGALFFMHNKKNSHGRRIGEFYRRIEFNTFRIEAP